MNLLIEKIKKNLEGEGTGSNILFLETSCLNYGSIIKEIRKSLIDSEIPYEWIIYKDPLNTDIRGKLLVIEVGLYFWNWKEPLTMSELLIERYALNGIHETPLLIVCNSKLFGWFDKQYILSFQSILESKLTNITPAKYQMPTDILGTQLVAFVESDQRYFILDLKISEISSEKFESYSQFVSDACMRYRSAVSGSNILHKLVVTETGDEFEKYENFLANNNSFYHQKIVIVLYSTRGCEEFMECNPKFDELTTPRIVVSEH